MLSMHSGIAVLLGMEGNRVVFFFPPLSVAVFIGVHDTKARDF